MNSQTYPQGKRAWTRTISAVLIFACVSLLLPVGPMPGAGAHAPLGLVVGPDRMVAVIVQKTVNDDRVEKLVTRLGGAVTRDLHIINGFAAEVPERALPELARAEGVRWVSRDALVMSSQTISTPTTFTTWATSQGTSDLVLNPVPADFNSTAIGAGKTIWFNAVLKPSGLGTTPVTIRFFNSTIQFTANGTSYALSVPNATLTYSPTATLAATRFDAATNTWMTTVPSSYTGNVFLAGLAYVVPVALPGSLSPVTWSGQFISSDTDVSVNWQWAAAVYSAFSADYNALKVKPIDGNKLNPYANSDKAGAPEAFKASVIQGASGGGSSNYTGNFCASEYAMYSFNAADKMTDSALGPNGTFGYGSTTEASLTGFVPEVTPGHAIQKVEVVLQTYVPTQLAHDVVLNVSVGGVAKTKTINHSAFGPYVGAANAGALYVDITSLRTWQWADFDNGLELVIDQDKLYSPDLVYYDAVGLRVTSAPGTDTTGGSGPTSLPKGALDTSKLLNVYDKVVRATDVWNQSPAYLQGQGVTVAVVDSGMFKTKDLDKRIIKNVNFNSAFHDAADRFGHGTFVAGIIAGNGAQSGGQRIGIAPKTNLLNVRVSDDNGMSSESDVVAALQWVNDNQAKHNIRVVNLSLNSIQAESYHTNPLDAACEILWFNGIVVVTSAGNNGTSTLYPPANDPFVITVGATDDRGTASLTDDAVASFSAYGTLSVKNPNGTTFTYTKPDLVAPGKNIIANLPENDKINISNAHAANRIDKNYFKMSGTSMSAPMVSGAVALLLQDEPGLTPDQVKYRLKATANKTWAGYTSTKAGAGYLDIYAAVNGTTAQSANTGIQASHLLWTGEQSLTWGSVSWDSVSWDSVSWDSVSWDSVSWDSVSWDSDYWGQ